MAGPHAAQADTIKRIPNPQEPVPALALPTAALFFGSLVAWGVSSFLALSGLWPWPISTVINGLAAFVLFTVAHEASHNTCSRLGWVNLWMGRIAIPFFGPGAGFQAFRFIHMQHHRFTNHEDGSDPDHYTQL
ncbi:MAG: fatty acid desaturase, partial [Thermoleophilaceae bacterium]|nr:fatty acid desaturase [Thermoleophilaceae bacterium]